VNIQFTKKHLLKCLVLILMVLGFALPVDASALSNPAEPAANCDPLVQPILEQDPSLSTLIDPVVTSQVELAQRKEMFSELHSCLSAGLDERSAIEKRIHALSEYFLIFADGYQTETDQTQLEFVNLADSEDPAVVSLRDEVGLTPPDGYVFLRLYDSRQAMPARVQRVFANPNVSGATFLTRYIAVLAEDESAWQLDALQSLALPKTISHELVHAYINSAIGAQRYSELPIWYHEGLAIYFSHSGKNTSIITPDLSVSRTSTEEYQQYELNFRYLESQLGRQNLLENISRSILEIDESLLFEDLGIESADDLTQRASKWQAGRIQNRMWVVLALAILVGWGMYRMLPEARCDCGYQGRRSDFVDGICPQCGRYHEF
jgi:hypothetical protein